MQKKILDRRRALWYLGLGLVGTGGAFALSRFSGTNGSDTLIPNLAPVIPDVNSVAPNSQPNAAQEAVRMPELQGIEAWLNSPPLSIASLQGSVVLLQFWTFACINCQRTLPYLVKWHQQYAARGLTILGVHTPEFAFERDLSNVKQALEQYNITYPVAIDNGFQTWKAYKNEYWPHLFLADRQGNLRYDHIGEGAYTETEAKINQLLG
ncbi:MAG: thioredoxin family protein [Coleofasciculaceae cyanobacterium SM2_1_6]|nr:thioredoxin family protein [Coleofasciculaceae cyanobacterium SM2_1_6]